MSTSECDVPVPGIPATGNLSFFGGIGTGIGKIGTGKSLRTGTETDLGISQIYYGYRDFFIFWWYLKNLIPDKSLGTGIGKIWYGKKSRKNCTKKKGTGIKNIL